MLILTEKVSAEAQRLWQRFQNGQLQERELRRAAYLRDQPAMAALGKEEVASCGLNDIQERSLGWGESFSTHTFVFLSVCLADLIECNQNCSPQLVCALDRLEQWQRHPTVRAIQNVAWAYSQAQTAFRRASRGMDMSGYTDWSAISFGLSALVLESTMKSVIGQFDEHSFRFSFSHAVRARTAAVQGLVKSPNKTARRMLSRHLRFELANWVLRRDYDWRFLVSSSP